MSGDKLAEASTEAAIAEDHPLSGVTPDLGSHAHTPKICYSQLHNQRVPGKRGGLSPPIKCGVGGRKKEGGRKRSKTAFFRNVLYFSNKILVLL